jgi:hypothetical protein
MSASRWPRWTLLSALLVLGGAYIVAFTFFIAESRDFVVDLHNRRAMESAIAAPIEVPKTLQLTAGTAGAALFGGGWYAPEPLGTWSSSSDSWIALAFRDADAGVRITLTGTAFIARHHKKIVVTADVAGHRLASWQRTYRNVSDPLQFCIPAAISRSRDLMLHLHVDSLASPLEVGTGQDRRRLGLLLTSMELSGSCESESQDAPAGR